MYPILGAITYGPLFRGPQSMDPLNMMNYFQRQIASEMQTKLALRARNNCLQQEELTAFLGGLLIASQDMALCTLPLLRG